ncbi:hypothetical protein [uncultured Tenacibaculum sp.]|uniref:hypothetical protein n=1 Tax=uncultured Tenacibaculum sp. TaxID=174713 RepID=UPI002638932F|nr:hypothetical protein [uncultured Tenacibaculum sp.]
MVEKFKLWYNALNENEKKEIIQYILNNNIQSTNEGYFTGPSTNIEKGLFTGPTSSSQKCRLCGK